MTGRRRPFRKVLGLAVFLSCVSLAWLAVRCRAAGSGEIPFHKHTLDLGANETCAVADVKQDGKLDIISGENWYQQAAPAAKGEGPRWIKHKFRNLPYSDYYIDDFSDLPIDVLFAFLRLTMSA